MSRGRWRSSTECRRAKPACRSQAEQGLYAVNVKGTLREEQACGTGRRACEEIIVFDSFSRTGDQGWGTCCSPRHYAGSSIHLQTDWIQPYRAWSAAHKIRKILSGLHPPQDEAFWTSGIALRRRKWNLGLKRDLKPEEAADLPGKWPVSTVLVKQFPGHRGNDYTYM